MGKKIVYFDIFQGFYAPPGEFYGPSYGGVGDLPEQEGFYDYPVRGNRGFRGGRGRGARRGRITKTEKFVFPIKILETFFLLSTDNNNTNDTNDQQEGENNTNKRRQRRQRRRTNDNGSGTEQQTDG
jgi:hypothetical protein